MENKLQILKFIIEGTTSSKVATKGMQAGFASKIENVLPELLGNAIKSASKETSVAEILGYEGKIAAESSAHASKAVKVQDGYVKELLEKGAVKDAKIYTKEEAKAAIKPAAEVNNEAYRVSGREFTPEEKKIHKIKQLMKGEKAKYERYNTEYRQAQKARAREFNTELNKWSRRYIMAVNAFDKAKAAGQDTKVIEQSIKNIERNAQKALAERLYHMRTLTPAEINTKIQEAMDYMQARVQNATYRHASTQGTVNNAWELLDEGFEEFKSLIGTKLYSKLTPEQLKFMIDSRVKKIEELVSRAKLEDKLTVSPTVEFNGMKFPVKISLAGTSKTDEIAQITGGKTPKEALKYYRELSAKIDKACAELKKVQEMRQNGYIQLKIKPIEFPIHDLEKSDKLKFFEAQLKEKYAKLDKIQENDLNRMVAKSAE